MKFNPLSILFVGTMLIASISAQAFSVVVRYDNGNSTKYDSENVDNIKFSTEGVVTIALTDGNVTEIKYDEFSAILFNSVENGIDNVANDQLHFTINDNTLSLTDSAATVEITSVTGATVAKGIGTVSIASLPSGIYIVNSGDKSAKIILK